MSYTSSYTSGTYSSAQNATSSGDDSSSSSTSVDVTVQSSSPDDSGGLYAAAGADALAAGEDTLAAASVSGEIVDGGLTTSVDLSASALAAAETPEGEIAFTSADTFAAVSDGADLLVTYTAQSDSTTQNATGSNAVSSSTTQVTAVDIDLTASGGGSTSSEAAPETVQSASDDLSSTDASGDGGLDGNIAIAEFDVAAIGENTFANVDALALAVEDELSVATVSTELGVD